MASIVPQQKKTLTERLDLLDKIADQTNKKYGKTIMGRIGANEEIMDKLRLKFIPTPCDDYNAATGGGFPKGRMTIVTGDEDSGKTGILLNTIAYNQKINPEFVGGWLESEHSLKKEWLCDTFGIDPDRFFYVPLSSDIGTEKTLDIVEGLLAAGAVDMFCINSMRCLIPDKEREKGLSEASVAEQARLNAKIMRKWTGIVAENDIAFVVVQHLTTAIGVMYGDTKVLAGGDAFKYWSSLTLRHSKLSVKDSDPVPRDEKGKPLGAKFGVRIMKNHCIPESPRQYAKFEYFVVFGEGVETIATTVDKALEIGLLEKHGNWLWWMVDGEAKEKFSGRAAFREFMKANPEAWEEYRNMLGETTFTIEDLSEEEIEEIEKEEKKLRKKKAETDKLLESIENEEVAPS